MGRNSLAYPEETIRAAIHDYVVEMMSLSQVGEKYGMSIQTVSNHLKWNGIKARRYTTKKVTERRCQKCKDIKPIDEFYQRRERPGKYSYLCKPCHLVKSREQRWKNIYGISKDEYEAMLAAQGGVCAICHRPQTERIRHFAVDHCHTSGKVRGLLCQNCNLGIGNLQDEPEIIRRALEYVIQHQTS